jgi:two-component system cell cycle sensor histidine kinase/response regulator CckA
VSDTGDGMDAATKDRIFEPFFTTGQRAGKAGMGLAMVYGIVRQSGGAISVSSAPGEGTTFFVHFPLVAESVAGADGTPVQAGASALPDRTTALLVEDDAAIRQMIADILHDKDIEVLPAYSSETAWVAARGHRGPLQLLITDVALASGSGADVAAQIGQIHPEAKVLFLNSLPHDGASTFGLSGDAEVLDPPFTRDSVSARIDSLLREHQPQRI